jgi:hypothetical protein
MFDALPLHLKFPGFKINLADLEATKGVPLEDTRKLRAAVDVVQTQLLTLLWQVLPLQYNHMAILAEYLACKIAGHHMDLPEVPGVSARDTEELLQRLHSEDMIIALATRICLEQVAAYSAEHHKRYDEWSRLEVKARKNAINMFLDQQGVQYKGHEEQLKKLFIASLEILDTDDLTKALGALSLRQHDAVNTEYAEHPLVKAGVATVDQIAVLNPLVRFIAVDSYLAYPERVRAIFAEAQSSIDAEMVLKGLNTEQWLQLVAGHYTSVEAYGFTRRYSMLLPEVNAAIQTKDNARLATALAQLATKPADLEYLLTAVFVSYPARPCLLERILLTRDVSLIATLAALKNVQGQSLLADYFAAHPEMLLEMAAHNTASFIKFLSQFGQDARLDMIRTAYSDGKNLLEWAAERGDNFLIAGLRGLVDRDTWVNLITSRADDGQIPLHRACLSGNDACVKVLLEGDLPQEVVLEQLTARDEHGYTPLHQAKNDGVVSTLQSYAPSGWTWSAWPKMVEAESAQRETPLHRMAADGNGRAMDALLNTLGKTSQWIQLEYQAADRSNILHLAQTKEVVKLVCKRLTQNMGMDLLEACNDKGNTPLLQAIDDRRVGAASELIGYADSLCPSSLLESPLYRAALSASWPMTVMVTHHYLNVSDGDIKTHAKHMHGVLQAYMGLPEDERNAKIQTVLEEKLAEAQERVPAGFVARLFGGAAAKATEVGAER